MADLIITQSSPNNCSHHILGGLDDGAAWSGLQVDDAALLVPLTTEEQIQLRLLLLRKLRQKGVTIQQFINRVVRGEEATNLKIYNLISPGAAITKTNIGTAYVNISPRLNGERQLIEFVGCTEFRMRAWVNLVGSGQWGMRAIRDDNTVLFESANLGAAGERELDTDWQPIPAAFLGTTGFIRAQGKSTTAADDPVFGGIQLAVR